MRGDDAPLRRLDDVLELEETAAVSADGYVDLLGGEGSRHPTGLAQRLMESTAVPRIYERWWRPALGRIAKGVGGPSMEDEAAAARRLLDLRPGAFVVDLACGPGNFTRAFSRDVGPDGFVVGVDLSTTMLRRAVRDTDAANVCYVRGDAADLPYRPGSVDAICCFAALHLFADAERALDGMAQALRPGGRLVVLTSERPSSTIGGFVTGLGGRLTGMRIFGPGELPELLADSGLEVTHHERSGAVQITAARSA